jgi:hypothetical protein
MQLASPENPVSFWRFAAPVIAGNAAAWGTVWLTKRALKGAHPTAQKTAATLVGIGTFWIVGGLGWVALSRRV